MSGPLSPRNPRLKHLARLIRERSARIDAGSFVIEGPKLVAEAVADGFPLEAVFVDDRMHAGGPTSGGDGGGRASEVAASAAAAGIAVHTVVAGALDAVLDTVTSQGVAAVAALPASALDDLAPVDLVLVLVGVSDPGNAGTLLRTAVAAGAGGVICTSGTVDPFAPKAVRASAGAALRVPVVTGVSAPDALRWLGSAGHRRLATDPVAGAAYDRTDLRGPIALVLGSEAHGLPPELRGSGGGLIDETLTIPMAGGSESLNVAMAGAIICFEVRRQRRASGAGRDGP